ncbi:MAG: FMN-binding protein [Sporomusaceae bacterium]|nr:FMN-binding protein [Sporomusaceae bacterium]
MNKWGAVVLAGTLSAGLLAGCGNQQAKDSHEGHEGHENQAKQAAAAYKDGTYKGVSSPDERGAVGQITIIVQQGRISKADYEGVQKDGKIKDADYGKTNGKIENPEFYKKAQQALQGARSYGSKLVAVQDVAKVDAVSGATVSYKQFAEAATKALEQAH